MADVRYFLKLGNIAGESAEKGHAKEIEVLSFGWGAVQTVAGPSGGGGGGATGKVDIDELTFVAASSIASPPMFQACASGQHLPEAVLTGQRQGGKGKANDFLVIKLHDVLIASYHQFGGDGELPEDEVSLVFEKLEMTSSNGTITTMASWDTRANQP